MSDLVSVIINVYNCKEYLPYSLESVRQQTYKNLYGKEVTTINSTIPVIVGGETVAAIEMAKDITDIQQMSDKMMEQCRYETGLFPIGSNPYVDKLVFNCGSFTPLPDYPYTWVIGKKLEKGPTDYRDVRKELQRDCLKAKKNSLIEAFIQKYAVEIDKEVLKTVNRAENK